MHTVFLYHVKHYAYTPDQRVYHLQYDWQLRDTGQRTITRKLHHRSTDLLVQAD